MTAARKTKKKKAASKKPTTSSGSFMGKKFYANIFSALKRRVQGLLARRPHRSFRVTRRRDYVRPLRLPGYWSFTGEVRSVLLGNKRLFLSLATFYAIVTGLLVGIASQENYSELGEVIREAAGEFISGDFSELENAGVTLVSIVTGSLNTNLTDVQGIFAVILGLLIWLTTVWLLRAVGAGRRPNLRDGLYNAGAPIISTFFVGFVLLLQLVPIALIIAAYGAATSTGLLNTGVEAMVFWTLAALLALLSIYWISSTFIALIVITLPGMYPMEAIRTAGDLIIGRRIRILLRLLWLLLIVTLAWIVVMLPIILIDAWLKGIWPAIEWIPVVPLALLIMGSLTVVWSASYTYLLYRKVVDDDAAPA